ncbi:MAG TPA: Calx-beta domain-containing protein, partial [Pyrinomonadaceae bacterium]|nr:Calx-beta domain-containing protein [Pyrinomonadaceae bacterium]
RPSTKPAKPSKTDSNLDTPTFHGDRQRVGWNQFEAVLTPTKVSSADFGPLWNSPAFDSVTVNSQTYAPHLYATPLYLDSVTLSGGAFAGLQCSVIFAATSNGFVYAVNAFDTNGVPAGTILWSRQLGTPARVPSLDGGLPLGILSTPIIARHLSPPRIYVASMDATAGWQVFAVDITNGQVLPGWPIQINDAVLGPVNQNGPARFQAATTMSQRGALNMSLDGGLLYVPFGSYFDGGVGWIVAVDTVHPGVVTAFAAAPSMDAIGNGGMWAAGGPAIDLSGRVYLTTGNSPAGSNNTPRVWGDSLLVWSPLSTLQLAGTYSTFNYCDLDRSDIDLSGSSAVIIPDLDPATTSTPHLVTFGGKQGNVYLLDRDNLPGRLDQRPACSTDSSTDRSLLSPNIQPQFNARGPLNVFGPYSESVGLGDRAKMRSTPAYYRAADGSHYLIVSGSTKADVNSPVAVPPCLARLRIVTAPGSPSFLRLDATENSLVFLSPGSPVVTSNGSSDAIVWVLDANLLRSQALIGANVPHTVLYAVDAATFKPIWQSTTNVLNVGGKYNTPTIARGVVFVGTDRIQAFGLGTTTAHFSASSYSVNEGDRSAIITVTRSGDTSVASTVDYATSDGTAQQRTRYTTTSGSLSFAPGELSKSFNVLVTDNAYVDGAQTVTLTLSNPTGETLGTPSQVELTITDNDTAPPTTNPDDDAQFFVRQHYLDFLSREPDAGGLAFWTGHITECASDAVCTRSRRVGTSAAFFIEREFQQTGFFVYRLYNASYGRRPLYAEFVSDRSRVVGGSSLEANKTALVSDFVRRTVFKQMYPDSLSNEQFVNSLFDTAGLV